MINHRLLAAAVSLGIASVGTAADLRGGLDGVIATADQRDWIPVTVVLRERLSSGAVAAATEAMPRTEKRDPAVAMLRAHWDAKSAALRTAIDTEVARRGVRRARDLWIAGAIAIEARPDAIRRLSAHPDVAWINWDRPLAAEIFPTGPVVDGAFEGGGLVCGVEKVRADEVWAMNIEGAGVVVAVIDTGACTAHDDLDSHIWVNPGETPGNGLDDDGNGYVDDVNGWNFRDGTNDLVDENSHGTHVAGIVCGDGTNGYDTGSARGATVMPLKMWNSFAGESVVWEAVQYAAANGADVISMSLGWPHWSSPDRATWRTTCENAINAGVVFVVAAGNGGNDAPPVDNITTPGDVPAVITVGATNCTDQYAGFSSVGPTTWQNVEPWFDHPYPPGLMKPDVAAPGVGIISTKNTDGCVSYTIKSGTSMATPLVAGVVALMLEANPNLDHAQIKSILRNSAVDLGSPGPDNMFGAGRVDAVVAVGTALPPGPDLDHDGDVDPDDLLLLLAEWGPCPAEEACDADFDDDGRVGFTDLLVILANWS